MGAVARQAGKCVFKRSGTTTGFQRGGSIEGDQAPPVQERDAIGEEFDFGKGVRSKEQGSALPRQNFRLEEAPEIGGGESIEATCGLVQKKNLRPVQERAQKAKALNGARGERAHLAIQHGCKFKLLGRGMNLSFQVGIRKMIQAPKEAEVLVSCEAGIETEIGASVVAEMPAHSG